MRAKKCGMTADEKQFRRLHYCGTCKTMGSLYGQKSRLLLNHDTVFLAEILTSLSDENVDDWQKSYQSYNCMSLPKSQMPVSLQFAAAANIILSEFKIADHIEDSRQKRFKLAHRIFSKEFLKAEKSLKDWDFPLEKVREILQSQSVREAENASLESLAEPTAATTALFFAHGVELIGHGEFKRTASEIGFAFGKLIYLLDALEDFEKDVKTNQFNAIRAAYDLRENKLSPEIRRKVATVLRELENEIITKIYELPITGTRRRIFASRLQSNLQKKLQTELPVLVCKPKKRLTFAERFERAKIRAKELTTNRSWATFLPIFIFILAFALIAPAQAKEARSARECFDLSFNLMFIGAVLGSGAAALKPIFMQTPEEVLAEEARKKAAQGAQGDDGGIVEAIGEEVTDPENWCDACECCCCDCDNGCCCSCDNCGCGNCGCGGCCDNCDCGGCCDCDCN